VSAVVNRVLRGRKLAVALVASAGLAVGVLSGCDPVITPAVTCGGVANPEVDFLGDSISAAVFFHNCDIDNQLHWYTASYFKGGIATSGWLADPGALQVIEFSKAKAIYIELGTNDLIDVWKGTQSMLGAKINMDTLASKFPGRCIVWQGQNEQFDGLGGVGGPTVIPTARAAEYNNMLKEYAASHPNVHYADYNAFVAGNGTYRSGVLLDGPHIHPQDNPSQTALALFEASQIRADCGV
jgi:hypothetical protein